MCNLNVLVHANYEPFSNRATEHDPIVNFSISDTLCCYFNESAPLLGHSFYSMSNKAHRLHARGALLKTRLEKSRDQNTRAIEKAMALQNAQCDWCFLREVGGAAQILTVRGGC